jgi:CheY-like chemotaxis protein
MDIQMPEVDGLEAARLIRQEERHRSTRIPIVALTAHASQTQHDHCLAAGMDAVMTKPINLAALLRCIGEVLGCTSPAVA